MLALACYGPCQASRPPPPAYVVTGKRGLGKAIVRPPSGDFRILRGGCRPPRLPRAPLPTARPPAYYLRTAPRANRAPTTCPPRAGFYFINMTMQMLMAGSTFCRDAAPATTRARISAELEEAMAYHRSSKAFEDLLHGARTDRARTHPARTSPPALHPPYTRPPCSSTRHLFPSHPLYSSPAGVPSSLGAGLEEQICTDPDPDTYDRIFKDTQAGLDRNVLDPNKKCDYLVGGEGGAPDSVAVPSYLTRDGCQKEGPAGIRASSAVGVEDLRLV